MLELLFSKKLEVLGLVHSVDLAEAGSFHSVLVRLPSVELEPTDYLLELRELDPRLSFHHLLGW